MKTTLRVDDVNYVVSQVLLDLGVSEEAVVRMHGTVLEHAGKQIAKRYRADNIIALWVIDQNLIRFYNTYGQLLRTIELD